MKFICAPDSFKESLSALKAASAMADGIRSVLPDARIDLCPVGDGGEGTLDALLASAGGRLLNVQVTGPFAKIVDASFGMLGGEKCAFVESAMAIGLPLIPAQQRDVMSTTSFGVGELILSAISHDAAEIVVGLGGTATNDGGCGMAQALGVMFFDSQDNLIEQPICGEMLGMITRIDATHRNPALECVSVTVACK